MVSTTTTAEATHSSSTSDKSKLQSVLAMHDRCADFVGHLDTFHAQLSSRLSDASSAAVASNTRTAPAAIFTSGRSSLAILAEKCEESVRTALLIPVEKQLAGYHQSPIWTATAAALSAPTPAPYTIGTASPSERVRVIGEWLMELPMELEALRVEAAAIEGWIKAVVQRIATQFLKGVETIVITVKCAR